MNLCICRVFVCFNLVSQLEFLFGIAQLVARDATFSQGILHLFASCLFFLQRT
jgi:hypothetical protein